MKCPKSLLCRELTCNGEPVHVVDEVDVDQDCYRDRVPAPEHIMMKVNIVKYQLREYFFLQMFTSESCEQRKYILVVFNH